MYASGVHNGILLYLDKTTLQSKIFTVPYNAEMVNDILDRFRNLHKFLKSNELPNAEAKFSSDISWLCRFCEYKDKCDKNET